MKTIELKNLGKKYTISHESKGHDSYTTLRDMIAYGSKNLWNRVRGGKNKSYTKEEIWALKNVTFEVKSGEKVGIIGHNGAGKSTLLKILSRITEPTEGYVRIKGRVSSLLEVGTGFHPELTGRENIYLNGAILGMKKAEIERSFDEIVDFSGVEKFLDTPVKRYSSGMKVRLAFAVSAHLEPEILLIDEVLAVGDAEFQKKCLGKMDQVSTQYGRTILFVSHNLPAIQSLCSRAILLQDGRVSADGTVDRIIQEYIGSVNERMTRYALADRKDRIGGEFFRFTNVEFFDARDNTLLPVLLSGQDILVRIHYSFRGQERLTGVLIGIGFFTNDGKYLFGCASSTLNKYHSIESPSGYVTCRIPKWPLTEGEYRYSLTASGQNGRLDRIEDAGFLEVKTGDYYGTGKTHDARQSFLVDYEWIGD